MKRIQPRISGPAKGEVLDGAKRQYRIVVEAARQLEDKQSRVQSCAELFQPELIARRARLAELCERLALAEPSVYGRKAEEILWKKTLYDVVSLAKRLRKEKSWSPSEQSQVQSHLLAGVGSYHQLVSRLQAEFQLDLRGEFDLPISLGDNSLASSGGKQSRDEGARGWARQAVHRSLVCLGDLGRYLADLGPAWGTAQAERCYLQAASLDPKAGMPHNQLGTLAAARGRSVDAAFHYMRCLASAQPFEGAEGNLQRLMEREAALLLRQPPSGRDDAPRSPAELVRRCQARLLMLADTWFFNRAPGQDHHQACEETLADLEQCLAFPRATNQAEEPEVTPGEAWLDDNALFKMTAIVLLCVGSLRTKGSPLLLASSRFALGLLGRLTQRAVSLVEAEGGAGGRKKRRREKLHRRRRGSGSSDESDLSQGEVESEGSSSEAVSEESAPEEDGSSSEGEGERGAGLAVRVLASQQGLLAATKLCCDWLRGDRTALLAWANHARPQLEGLVRLVNLVAGDTNKGGPEVLAAAGLVPLPEDVATRGVPALAEAQAALDWGFPARNRLRAREETLLRTYKLLNFGHFLAERPELGVTLDPGRGLFQLGAAPVNSNLTRRPDNEAPASGPESRRQLMRHMGQLWLRAEVRELEVRVRGREGACSFSPYLVLDVAALLSHLQLVRQLVSSRKFVVVIPCVVVGALDDLKRESVRAREATRWLESQFQRGNRFLRAQRANESLALPLIKYPKKKDKEAWVFFQVLECCSHLARQAAVGAGADQPAGAALVTLLSGAGDAAGPPASKDFSPIGLAHSAGVKLESVASFCAKWKGPTKNRG